MRAHISQASSFDGRPRSQRREAGCPGGTDGWFSSRLPCQTPGPRPRVPEEAVCRSWIIAMRTLSADAVVGTRRPMVAGQPSNLVTGCLRLAVGVALRTQCLAPRPGLRASAPD